MCIMESMRLHTPVPFIAREVDKEFELDGVTLPVGTKVQVYFHLMHNNKAVWGDDYKVSIGTIVSNFTISVLNFDVY